MTAKFHAGVSLKNGAEFGFHTSTVSDPQIGVWCPLPGYATYWYAAMNGASKEEMARELIPQAKTIAAALHCAEADLKKFLEEYVANIVAANAPKPAKVPKPPKSSGGVTVPPPGTVTAAAPDPVKDANLNKIREAANKAKAAKKA